MGAIWKDLFIELTGETADYDISLGEEIIFKGRARLSPDEQTIKVHVNGACAGYIDSNLEGIDEVLAHTGVTSIHMNCYREFSLNRGESSTAFTFHNDWSYDRKRSDISPQSNPDQFGQADTKGCISDPISTHVAPGQILAYSYINTRASSTIIQYKEFFRSSAALNGKSIGAGNAATLLWIPDVGYESCWFNVEQITFTPDRCGKRYAILYQNAYGGYDSFLLEGNCFRQGKTTTHSYTKAIDNNIETARGLTNYANEIEHTWTCNTSWLSDDQSLKFAKHVLPSTNIYLQDMEEQTITPVTITASTYKYKTYKNEGRKIVSYQFTLKESNGEVRQ